LIYSRIFMKQLKSIIKNDNSKLKERIKLMIQKLSQDPYSKRSGMDIKLISSRDEAVYRIRIGNYRLVYEIDECEKIIFVTSIFVRGKGYNRSIR